MKKGISVIIPCYNTDKYLDKCLESILNQTFKNVEIILVDDCSKDDTWKLIKKYEKKYENITAIKNKVNSGAGFSRNRALEKAKYDYISFIDSDDYVEENYYEELLNTLETEKADIAVCDIYVKYTESSEIDVRSCAYLSSEKDDKYGFINNGLAASPCNKLFKKELLVKFPFAEGIMNEDVPTVLASLIDASKVAYNKNTFYSYIQRKSSVQNGGLSDKRFDIFKALEVLETRVPRNSKTEKYWNAIIFNQIIMFLIYVIPKEERFFTRVKFLKKFKKHAHKYTIRRNHLWWDFLSAQGKYHNIYYRAFLKLLSMHCYLLANSTLSFYKFYHKHFKKSIIKDDINLYDVVKMAKKQSKMKAHTPTISVVIPNYNYEKFMLQRIYSILFQKVKINELIILDDCSKDESRKLIDEIEIKLQPYINVKKVYNETNSGSAFKQWEKGFSLATSDYVWIAEADDYCQNNFLKEVIKPIKKDIDVYISYADTAFIDRDGIIIMRTIKPEIDILKTGHWDSDFVNDGIKEIKAHSFLNCTIANVSSVLFKNDNYTKEFKESGKYKQAGDWLFYVNVMAKGKIAFHNKPLNYYRVHGSNVTTLTKKQAHFDEIVRIHKSIDEKFTITKKQKSLIEKRYKFLKRVWNL